MTTFNIIEELRKCIDTFDDLERGYFNYYCLGIKQNNANIESNTLDEYLDIVAKSIAAKQSLGRQFVVYKSISVNDDIVQDTVSYWNKIDVTKCLNKNSITAKINKLYNSTRYAHYSCFVVNPSIMKPANRTKFPTFKYTFDGLLANSAFVFLIHPSIQSFDYNEIAVFASVWDKWVRKLLVMTPVPGFLFVYGNSKKLYTGHRLPTNSEIKANKLNVSMDMPITSIAYEKE